MGRKTLSKVARQIVEEEDIEERLNHSKETFCIAEGEVASLWAAAVSNLRSFQLKFALKCLPGYIATQL